jgi:hypothetical protein
MLLMLLTYFSFKINVVNAFIQQKRFLSLKFLNANLLYKINRLYRGLVFPVIYSSVF